MHTLVHRPFFWFGGGMKIAVVGGGIGGLVGSLLALEAGHKVEIFEKHTLGSGASGKALGVLVPITGLDRPIDRLQQAGIAGWPEFARRLADMSGVALGDFWRDWGNGCQQVRLPLLFDVLAKAIAVKGGIVHEHAMVDSPARLAERFDRVVLAAGLGNIALHGAAMKVSAGVAARLEGHAESLIAGDNLFVCPDWDGCVIAGSVNWEMATAGDGVVPADKLEELLLRVGRLVPTLAGVRVVESWVGYRPVEVPRLPLVKPVSGNVVAVVGLGKIGIGVSPMLRIWD